ncbi:hypothetical protein [Flavobacterium sp. J27]|uniref:hypothetical protein n=1 Tax=Flavobacterium sp. J27 TaxID=2060419 RepID=UPI001030D386|nr:hypothetical protein [Flavobacterium sp. J27]
MIRKTVKYFLLSLITLLVGYVQLFASANDCQSLSSLISNTNSQEVLAGNELTKSLFFYDYIHTTVDVEAHKIHGVDVEIEEDEISSSKKTLDSTAFLSKYLYRSKQKILLIEQKEKLFSREVTSHISIKKLFIIFRVFRI